MKFISVLILILLMSCSVSNELQTQMKSQEDQMIQLSMKYNTLKTKYDSVSVKNSILTMQGEEYAKFAKRLRHLDKSLKNIRAKIRTNVGDIDVEFFPQFAPIHVLNFVRLAEGGFYNGTKFHRVIKGFMIQGGDPNTKGTDVRSFGSGGAISSIPEEFVSIHHDRGVLSMARTNDPNSATSQFFIIHKPAPHLDGKHSIFGRIVEGFDVLDKIAETEVNKKNHKLPPNYPLEEIEIISVDVYKMKTPVSQKSNKRAKKH